MKKVDNRLLLIDGITYKEFMNESKRYLDETVLEKLDDKEKTYYNFTKLNYTRSKRIEKTFIPDIELVSLMNEIKIPQKWLVITEDWCGDSAQNLPIITKYAETNELIEVEIIYRDKNTEIIDLYLTDGKSRSIPKIIAFNNEGDELFTWGPRPQKIQSKYKELKEKGLSYGEISEILHKWYSENKGAELVKELKELVNKTI